MDSENLTYAEENAVTYNLAHLDALRRQYKKRCAVPDCQLPLEPLVALNEIPGADGENKIVCELCHFMYWNVARNQFFRAAQIEFVADQRKRRGMLGRD